MSTPNNAVYEYGFSEMYRALETIDLDDAIEKAKEIKDLNVRSAVEKILSSRMRQLVENRKEVDKVFKRYSDLRDVEAKNIVGFLSEAKRTGIFDIVMKSVHAGFKTWEFSENKRSVFIKAIKSHFIKNSRFWESQIAEWENLFGIKTGNFLARLVKDGILKSLTTYECPICSGAVYDGSCEACFREFDEKDCEARIDYIKGDKFDEIDKYLDKEKG